MLTVRKSMAVTMWSACLVALALLPASAADVSIDAPPENDTLTGGPYDTLVEYSVDVDEESEEEIVKDTLYINDEVFGVHDHSANPRGEDL